MGKPSPENSEWLTRKVFVDAALRAAGWRVVAYADRPLSNVDRCAVAEYPTSNGPADYTLVMGGRVVGVADRLQARYEKAASYANKLTQSVLARAFRGKSTDRGCAGEGGGALVRDGGTAPRTDQSDKECGTQERRTTGEHKT